MLSFSAVMSNPFPPTHVSSVFPSFFHPGVCDGDVLLDSQMNVDQESQCLRHLILTDVSLKGKSFEHLLVDDEQLTRFRKFIEASNDAGLRPAEYVGLPWFVIDRDPGFVVKAHL